ncbi:MAG: electron transfer flavoprotein subunit alpha/FixB family protein [Solirubrobacterales bacterium]
MSGIVVLAETRRGELRPVTLELIGAARTLSEQGAGPVTVALIGADADAHVAAVGLAGVQDVLVVPSPQPQFEAHVTQAAVEALIEQRRPTLVLAGHTIDSLGFAPAVAARGSHGFASDVTEASWGEQGALVQRGAYGGKLIAELDFPGKQTVVLLLRAGAFAPADAAETGGGTAVERVELKLDGTGRTEHLELRDPPAGDVDITKADFLLSIGRGVGAAENLPPLERLAGAIGATLSVSGALVEAGMAPRTRKVGLTGATVAPRVYLALGISGAAQHLAGMSRSSTIIAVNTDPAARIFDIAHYGAVADLFEIAAELERLSA